VKSTDSADRTRTCDDAKRKAAAEAVNSHCSRLTGGRRCAGREDVLDLERVAPAAAAVNDHAVLGRAPATRTPSLHSVGPLHDTISSRIVGPGVGLSGVRGDDAIEAGAEFKKPEPAPMSGTR
jgi:hypothetical protein